MSGDSEVDESDTWWSAILSTLCPKMESIVKENTDRNEKFINYVVNDYIGGIENIFDIGIDFESTLDLRDLGYEDEMFEFAYDQYENYGFTQDSEDEDIYYYEDDPENQYDSNDMVEEMFDKFIDYKVSLGQFIETDEGWKIIINKWYVISKKGTSFAFDWDCKGNFAKMNTIDYSDLRQEITDLYAIPNDLLVVKITSEVVKKIAALLEKKEKYCE